jgi:N-acetylneuraminic acid mutarotase
MLVWGGWNQPSYFATGAAFDPSTSSWTAMSTASAPVGRSNHTAVWTGSEMLVWGGYDGATQLSTGGRYTP